MNKNELIKMAKACKSVEEFIALAKDNNIELSEEKANEYFKKLNGDNGEIVDEELENVAGGCNARGCW